MGVAREVVLVLERVCALPHCRERTAVCSLLFVCYCMIPNSTCDPKDRDAHTCHDPVSTFCPHVYQLAPPGVDDHTGTATALQIALASLPLVSHCSQNQPQGQHPPLHIRSTHSSPVHNAVQDGATFPASSLSSPPQHNHISQHVRDSCATSLRAP